MALVMLPCDLPWWDSVKRHLKAISNTKIIEELIDSMKKIHELCNVSLDPEEDTTDPNTFNAFQNFLENDLSNEERTNFFNKTLPNIVDWALKLKDNKPKNGLHFSLQQQPDCTELEYTFLSSLIANAFFSTFPKRTDKSHPTLQDFNFTHFFKYLNKNSQKAKLQSIFYYFDWMRDDGTTNGRMKIQRQVMTGKEWLTIEDWLECNLPLCPLQIRHEGRLDRTENEQLQICFTSAKLGGKVLGDGDSQECIGMVTSPEMLTLLLNVEALEDNEVVTVERVRHVARIIDPKNRAKVEKLDAPREITVCCLDADNYKHFIISQYEEDNILRELNKCLLAFQQRPYKAPEPQNQPIQRLRRLSPIGESVGSTHSDKLLIPIITQQSCSTNRSSSQASSTDNNNYSMNKLKVHLEMETKFQKKTLPENLVHNRRGRFIVLGSSGECLPVSRRSMNSSCYSSCESSEEEFHSAKDSVEDGSEDENYHKRYSIDLETAERRRTFAERLKDALRREISISSDSCESESNYAVEISVAGSDVEDRDIKVRRGGSTGFALQEDSLDENFLKDSLQQEKQWIDKFKNKQSVLSRKDSNKSSEYSFSTEYSSELEEVYEQFSKWLNNPILETDKGTKKELDSRDLAVVQFAGSLLKRTLSESFAGVPVPLTEANDNHKSDMEKTNRHVLSAKSLSLELARHKHKLAAQLITKMQSFNEENSNSMPLIVDGRKLKIKQPKRFITYVTEAIIQTLEDVNYVVSLPQMQQMSQINYKSNSGLRAVSTGNWGCGSSNKGDVQLKVIIQWLASSVAGIPYLTYYTCGHPQLVKLDTVCRILVDRKWTVKDLTEAVLRYSQHVLQGKEESGTLFEELIGVEKCL